MCFTVSIYSSTHQVETAVGATFSDDGEYQPYYHVSGFAHPRLPVITNQEPEHLTGASWGLVPSWVKSQHDAVEISKRTLNARCETITEKPSFRQVIKHRRALLPVDGFIEWRDEGSKKQPYFIRDTHSLPFTLGTVWDEWLDTETGEVLRSFSIVTTPANTLMQFVHNNKQRMPLVIEASARTQWLSDIDVSAVQKLMLPAADGRLEAFAISTEVSRIKVNTHQPELLSPLDNIVR